MPPDSDEERFRSSVHAIAWRRYAVPLTLAGIATLLWVFGNPEFNIAIGLLLYLASGVWVIVRLYKDTSKRERTWGDGSINRREIDIPMRGAGPAGSMIVALGLLVRTLRKSLKARRERNEREDV